MARAIKPCPYCGGEAKVRRVGRWRLRFSVCCSRCDISIHAPREGCDEWDSRWLPCGKEKTDGMDT